MEPDKLVELQWTDFGRLPRPFFLPWRQLLESPFLGAIKAAIEKKEP